jgi:hypothetical protein
MSETDNFYIINYKNKLILIFNSAKIEIKKWYLPNCNSFDNLYRQIAIETDLFSTEHLINKNLNNEINEEFAKKDIIDSGDLIIVKKSRYKIKFKLLGTSINQMFVMIAPSWGRWTKKNVWLIVSSKE